MAAATSTSLTPATTVCSETLADGSYTQSVVLDRGLAYPTGVAVDAGGSIYVVDSNHERVLKLTPDGDSYTQSVILDSGLSAPAVWPSTTAAISTLPIPRTTVS